MTVDLYRNFIPDRRKDNRSSQFRTNLSVMTPSMTLLNGPMSLVMPPPPCTHTGLQVLC